MEVLTNTILQDLADGAIAPGVGLVAYPFTAIDLAASLTNVQLNRSVDGEARQLSVSPPFRGSIVGISFRSTGSKTAGTATWTVFKDGVTTGATLTWEDAMASNYTSFPRGTYPFSAGNSLDIRITTNGSYAPLTNDVIVDLYVYLDQSVLS
jgi:hypothetical protein